MDKKGNKIVVIDKVKVKTHNFVSALKFVFNTIVLLITVAFSLVNIFLKVTKKGWSISVSILVASVGLYLILELLHYILYKARLSGKDDKKLVSFIDNFKYFIKIIKLAVPIVLLFNLIGNPTYDIFVILFSIVSIIFSFISFYLATVLLINKKQKKKK